MGLVFPGILSLSPQSCPQPLLPSSPHIHRNTLFVVEREREYRAEDEQEEERVRDRLLSVEFICSSTGLFPGLNSEKSHAWWSGGGVG